MISLAPIKYSDVLSSSGGPIDRVAYAPFDLFGVSCTQAVAYLREDLTPPGTKSCTVTPQPDGAGSHVSPQVACHMAVSEALERWAVYHCRSHLEDYASVIGADASSNGFAAYPGLFKRQARKAAFRESIERHCLMLWWEGLIEHHPLGDPRSGVRAIGLSNPFSSHEVIILWGMHKELHVFAFGAGSNVNQATWRALVEYDRTSQLAERIAKHCQSHGRETITDIYEKRINYFSGEDGFSRFVERLGSGVIGEPNDLRILFDSAVSGPWDRYVTVWRTVFDPPSRDYLSDREDYFFW